ncbi:MAG: hypothetical protein JSS75_12340 [Bacteroidetes bacterium]|nr:hypothetical protein [Bacteroidota bacterium]
MDNITIKLQEFLDGSLPGEEEAELLHRLSVSPERRDLLRSYMKQQAVFANDRAAIAVPYEAEQKLWAALAAMPSATAPFVSEVATSTATVAASSIFLKVASVALVSIVIGFATGYFIGNRPSADSNLVAVVPNSIPTNQPVSTVGTTSNRHSSDVAGTSNVLIGRVSSRAHATASTRQFPEAPLSDRIDMPAASFVDIADHDVAADASGIASIPSAMAFVPGASFVRDPNSSSANRPSIGDLNGDTHKRGPRFTDFLELSVHEGIGKQFPNSGATNVSIPIVTNTDVTMKFMIAHSFWVGAGIGLANITQKNLYEAPIAPNSTTHQIYWNYEHRNTAWFGLLAEFREPISEHFTIAANGGVAASSLGPIFSAEAGIRYAATESVGALAGLRLTRATSNVQAQHDRLTSPGGGTPGLSDTPGSTDDPAMINLELSTGIYFQF